MIYRNSYFKKELREAYSENRTSFKRKMASALFLGLISFALFFVFQTLQESVLADAVPQIMQPSFFSTIYIYIHFAFIFITIYFILHYDYLFFSEIRRNTWYLLIQMGYQPVVMFFSKFVALLYTVFLIYSVGFVFTLLLTVFLKYTFVLAYIPGLYFVGLIDVFFISILSLTFSLFAQTILNARYWTFFSAVFIFVLKMWLGEYTVISNRVAMQNLINLFDIQLSLYLPTAGFLMAACCLICLFRAGKLAQYYYLPTDSIRLTKDVQVITIDHKTGKRKSVENKERKAWRAKVFDTVVTAILIVFFCTALITNIFIILINTATPGEEVAFRGIIPYIFQSSTMEPEIKVNDLAYFQKVDNQYLITEGQIILFKEDNVSYVERVTKKINGNLQVDIDNYPPMSQSGAMKKTVPRAAVVGVYTGRNRWLGALILFANTIIGRILFLFVPAILLFYYKQIMASFKKVLST